MKKNNLSKTERMKTQSDMSLNRRSNVPYFRQSTNEKNGQRTSREELLKKIMEGKKTEKEDSPTSENPTP